MSADLDAALAVDLERVLSFCHPPRAWEPDPGRIGWWLRLLDEHGVDRSAYVRCICTIARLALPSMPRNVHLPREAIEAAEAWARAAMPRDNKRLRAAENRLRVALRDLRRTVEPPNAKQWRYRPEQVALCAALAVEAPEYGAQIPSVVCKVVGAPRSAPSLVDRMAELVLLQSWPVPSRLPREPCAPALCVAWDWLSEQVETRSALSTHEILRALCIGRALKQHIPARLTLSEPEQRLLRALAEQISAADDQIALIEGISPILGAAGS